MVVPDLQPLTQSQLALIDKEIEEQKINVDEEVEKLIGWINSQPHLPKYTDGEFKMRNFLYGKKYSVERTKQTLENYYSARSLLPEFFTDRDPMSTDMQDIFNNNYIGLLPKLTTEGYRIVVIVSRKPELNSPALHFYKLLITISEVVLLEDYSRGFIIVVNLAGIPLSMLIQHTPSMITKFLHYIFKCYPARVKGVHIINAPSYFDFSGNLVRALLPEKMKKRYTIHSTEKGYQPLIDLAGRDNIPIEFGGNNFTEDELADVNYDRVKKYRNWFIKEGSQTTEESRRVDETVAESAFGVAGSFRKLTVD